MPVSLNTGRFHLAKGGSQQSAAPGVSRGVGLLVLASWENLPLSVFSLSVHPKRCSPGSLPSVVARKPQLGLVHLPLSCPHRQFQGCLCSLTDLPFESWSSVRSWGQSAACSGGDTFHAHLGVEIRERRICQAAASQPTPLTRLGG